MANIKRELSGLTISALMVATLSACRSVDSIETTQIKIDGSSTVYPISRNVVEEFEATQGTKYTAVVSDIQLSGTTAGFEKFCQGETDINNASRPIHDHEMEACDQTGVRYTELIIGLDAITIVINPENKFAQDITLDELKKVWEPNAEGKITHWNQIRESWPNQPINLYGPGTDSGTYDYFTEAVLKKEGAIRNDYTANKNPNILVEKIANDPNALGYFGYGYYKFNTNQVKALAIKKENESVKATRYNIKWDQYRPLSRPLFIYVNLKASQDKPLLREFVHFYLENAPEFVSSGGYVPLPQEGYKLAKQHFETGKVGTVFEGQSQVELSLDQLLKKEAAF
ncbi:PstS family phosphate ABC transporter substrate-binding protein [Crocosphaera sp.]|uniref:PstS family phosphate ABC transporter substrate-binding protein n=1 Tax=Crocosphaera sp. TaxID=2729996 RepID=UPI003F28FDF3|nr:PstS family phosphate ABC transporter substrate-binding protein [Crocosphaera sp.]